MTRTDVILQAPAGDWSSLLAAVKSGADAVYFGVGNLNMRAGATVNFTVKDLPKIVRHCRHRRCRTFLTLNTVVYDGEMAQMRELCDAAKAAKVDAVIASDWAVVAYARSVGLEVHASVQCNVSNFEAVKFYAAYVDAVVLARELSLVEIAAICRQIREDNLCGPGGKLIKIEVFVHGALCIAQSGRCHMSLASTNRSANRGECQQNCRRSYRVIDCNTGREMELENEFVMSPRDLCMIEFLDELLGAGVSILKIEGRGRQPEYVRNTVRAYNLALDDYFAGVFSTERARAYKEKLADVFHRGFWDGGYYLGRQLDIWSGAAGSQARLRRVLLGRVDNYLAKLGVAEIVISARSLAKGERVLITGNATGVCEFTVEDMQLDHTNIDFAPAGSKIGVKTPQKVRPGDQCYVIVERKLADPID